MERRWWVWTLLFLVCTILPLAGAIYLIFWENKPVSIAVAAAIVMMLYFLPYWLLLITPLRLVWTASITKLGDRAWWILPIAYLIPNLLYRLVVGQPYAGMLHLALFLGAPTLLLWCARRRSRTINYIDLITLVLIWLPFDTGHLVPIWQVPGIYGLEAINSIMAVGYYATVFLCLRRMKGIGFEPRWQPQDRYWLLVGIAGALVVVMPFGLLTGFTSYNGQVWPWRALAASMGITFLIAIPEELLFRGFMQNALIQRFNRPGLSIAVMSLFFGVIHANNGLYPDWRFVVCASVVGLLCGIAHYKTNNLTAAVLIHTFVDAIWVGYLQTV